MRKFRPILCKYTVYLGLYTLLMQKVSGSIDFFSPCCTRRYLIIYNIYKHALSYLHTTAQYIVLLVLP